MNYELNEQFSIDCGFQVTGALVLNATERANHTLLTLPASLFGAIDYKTTSAMIGSIFCSELALAVGAMVNPIEKGHPDIIPLSARNSSEEQLRNYPCGLEIKCTVGNVETGANLRAGQCRLDQLVSIVWQAHHRDNAIKLSALVCEMEAGNADAVMSRSRSLPVCPGEFFGPWLA